VLFGLILVIAVAAAVRSTWSPCGVSMLSTLTPLAEHGRGHRFLPTAVFYVTGALLGGVTLGVGMAALAALVGTTGLSDTTALIVFAVLALVAAAFDSKIGGLALPGSKRQVNELWLNVYRPWVYSGGFGWQIGTGLLTYLMTGGVYLLVAGAALTGDPILAFVAGVSFGGVRGLFIFAGAGIDSHQRLVAFHRGFERLRHPSVVAMVVMLAVVAVVALGTGIGMIWAAVAAGAGVVFVINAVRLGRAQPMTAPRISPVPSVTQRLPTT
jgi:hypothetical protein